MKRLVTVIIAFVALALTPQLASAHHPNIEGSVARPCGLESEWTGTFTARADAVRGQQWQSRHGINSPPEGSWSTSVADSEPYGPIAVGPFAAGVASVTIRVESKWSGGAKDWREITLKRPAAYECPVVTTTTVPVTTTTTTTEVPPSTTTTTLPTDTTSTTLVPPTTVTTVPESSTTNPVTTTVAPETTTTLSPVTSTTTLTTVTPETTPEVTVGTAPVPPTIVDTPAPTPDVTPELPNTGSGTNAVITGAMLLIVGMLALNLSRRS